jgi:hypothetical protein
LEPELADASGSRDADGSAILAGQQPGFLPDGM